MIWDSDLLQIAKKLVIRELESLVAQLVFWFKSIKSSHLIFLLKSEFFLASLFYKLTFNRINLEQKLKFFILVNNLELLFFNVN